MKKKNGWSRLGVVLSIIYAAVIFNQEMRVRDFSVQLYDICMAAPSRDSGLCMRQLNERRAEENSERVRNAAISALAPLPFFWIFAYIVIATFRWVKHGFE